RRRHTRSKRDWSSDVCSSDLIEKDPSHRANRCPSSSPSQRGLGNLHDHPRRPAFPSSCYAAATSPPSLACYRIRNWLGRLACFLSGFACLALLSFSFRARLLSLFDSLSIGGASLCGGGPRC